MYAMNRNVATKVATNAQIRNVGADSENAGTESDKDRYGETI